MMHIMGQYVSFSFNDPGSYPERPITQEQDVKEEQTIEDMIMMAKINTIKMGGEIK